MQKIIQSKPCPNCGTSFNITDQDMEFYDKISPTFGGKKYSLPAPTLCPDCRQQRRLAFRNERSLYKRKCDASGKSIISIYSPNKSFPVYILDQWFSDNWDGLEYGNDMNFSKGFYKQFEELYMKVPKRALTNGKGSENCEYVNGVGMSKNCYLIFNSMYNENCYYGSNLRDCKNCIDNFGIQGSDILYQCVDCKESYNSSFLQNCENCKDSSFLKDCKDCDRCFACVNLQNKKYHILNKPYHTKEDYDKELSKIKDIFSMDQFTSFANRFPVQNLTNINIENCTGNIISNSKNVFLSFEVNNSQNIKYGYGIFNVNDSMDVSSVDGYVSGGCSNIYDSGFIFEQSSDILFSLNCRNGCHELIYCIECRLCQNCFGCSGLRNKQYCILNKQYTKSEYETLVPKIIEHMIKGGEWGECFPVSISPFGYNETVAQEYFPLNKDDSLKKGFKRSDYESPLPQVTKSLQANELPDIKNVTDDILNQAIICEITNKPFRIIKPELDFYKQHNIPLPVRHPDQRHIDRVHQRNPRKIFDRKCDKCNKEILSVYKPDSEFKVYCQNCYNHEVYG